MTGTDPHRAETKGVGSALRLVFRAVYDPVHDAFDFIRSAPKRAQDAHDETERAIVKMEGAANLLMGVSQDVIRDANSRRDPFQVAIDRLAERLRD